VKPGMGFSVINFGFWLGIMAVAIGAIAVASYVTWTLIEVLVADGYDN
jgi:hypothetical protein